MTKKKVIIIIALVLLLALIGGCIALIAWVTQPEDYCVYYSDRGYNPEDVTFVEIKVEGYDDPIILLLDKSIAPKTVKNFVSLVERGFYDGLTFHRTIKGFMIQGGDDSHLPEEEQAKSIPGEFLANGFRNELEHKRGVISMARATDPDSASSGFFICDADSPNLDGQYAAFGYVLEGLHTVDKIASRTSKYTDGNGHITNKSKQPVIEYIKILDKYVAK